MSPPSAQRGKVHWLLRSAATVAVAANAVYQSPLLYVHIYARTYVCNVILFPIGTRALAQCWFCRQFDFDHAAAAAAAAARCCARADRLSS